MQEVFYTHRRKNVFHKDYTLAGVVVETTLEWSDSSYTIEELHIGLAVCSPEDNFSKQVGRELAEQRAKTTPLVKLVISEDTPLHTFLAFAESFLPDSAVFEKIIVDVVTK